MDTNCPPFVAPRPMCSKTGRAAMATSIFDNETGAFVSVSAVYLDDGSTADVADLVECSMVKCNVTSACLEVDGGDDIPIDVVTMYAGTEKTAIKYYEAGTLTEWTGDPADLKPGCCTETIVIEGP